jgi:hypothetical protein
MAFIGSLPFDSNLIAAAAAMNAPNSLRVDALAGFSWLADTVVDVSYNRIRNNEGSAMMPCCKLTSISVVFLLAAAAEAQKRSIDKETRPRATATSKDASIQETNTGKPTVGAAAGALGKNAASQPDFKVLVWYRRDDPLGTFKYEVYDVRKAEYTNAVDHWVSKIEKSYPAYFVVVRGVDLKRERGETEQLKVGSVIKRELMVAAAMSGVFLGGGPSLGFQSAPETSRAQRPATSVGSLNRPLGSAGIDRSYLNPPPTPFPVPIPYPRPHP